MEEHERLLLTCSPFIRTVGLQVLADELRHQALVDPKDGKWYEVTATRVDTNTHKVYGIVREYSKMNTLGEVQEA